MSSPHAQPLPPLGLPEVSGAPKRASLPPAWHPPLSRASNRDSRGSRRSPATAGTTTGTSPTYRLGSSKSQTSGAPLLDTQGNWRALQAAAPDLTASMEIVPEKPGTKPPLLRRMEDFLAREMLLLEDSPQGAGLEAQLQVYRQCLSLFLQSFKTYSPILTEIIGCYETLLVDRLHHLHHASTTQSSEWGLEYKRLQLSLRVETLLAENEHLLTSLARETERTVQLAAQLAEVQRRNDFLETNKRDDYQRIVMLIAAVKDADERASVADHQLHELRVEVQEIRDSLPRRPTNEEAGGTAGEPRHETGQPVPHTDHERLKGEFATVRAQVYELERVNTYLRETVNAQRLDFEEKIMQIRSVVLSRKPHTEFEVELLGLCQV
eukprot:EG_transcript_8827